MYISFVLDRSGSMEAIWNDVAGGFKSFIEEQKKLGNPKFSLTTFDTIYDRVYDGVPLKEVSETLDDKRIFPRGATALLDAVASAVNAIPAKTKKAMIVIFTDGFENSSHEYTKQALKALIDKKQKKGWGFLFLGADQDAFAESSQFGMLRGQTISFDSLDGIAVADSVGLIASTATSAYLYNDKAVSVPETVSSSK